MIKPIIVSTSIISGNIMTYYLGYYSDKIIYFIYKQ